MKKVSVLLLIILFVFGMALYFESSSDSQSNSEGDTTKSEEKYLTDKIDRKTINHAKQEEKSNFTRRDNANMEKELDADNTPHQQPVKNNTGIDLSLHGTELAESYSKEAVSDYGWKSYWENELFVILMDSSRAFPFLGQETDCKKDTCKVEVAISMDKVQYMEEAVIAIDEEFASRNMPLAIERIDIANGVVSFYIQPGEISR